MATGMAPSDGYRLTATRRIALVLLSFVTASAMILAAPAYAAAAANFSSEVHFPADTENPTTRLTIGADCAVSYAQNIGDPLASIAPRLVDSSTSRVALTVNGGCRTAGGTTNSRTFGLSYASGGTWQHLQNVSPGGGLAEPSPLYMSGSGGGTSNCNATVTAWQYGAFTGSNLGSRTLVPNMTSPGSFSFVIEDWDVPVGTRVLAFHFAQWCYITHFAVADVEEITGGNCHGVAGVAGSDEQLVLPSSSVESPTGSETTWGGAWLATEEACLFSSNEVYHFTPTQGVGAGDTWTFRIQAWAASGYSARVTIAWVLASGGPTGGSVSAVNWRSDSPDPIDAVGSYGATLDVPAGASRVSISIGEGTILGGLLIANVEGDPILDGGTYPSTDEGTIPPVTEDYWEDCAPPEDALNVPGWLEYGACIVIGGFEFVGSWFATLTGRFIAGLIGLSADIAGAVLMGLGAVVGAIGSALSPVLEALFVPTTLGEDWQDFIDVAETRAPFGWFIQVADTIDDSLSAGTIGVGSLDLTLGGATVDVGFGDALDAVAPYRGFILAGASIVMLLGCLRWIMAAVGVSPGGHGGGGS